MSSTSNEPGDVVQVPLKRPPFWAPIRVVMTVLASVWLVQGVLAWFEQSERQNPTLLLSASVLVLGFIGRARYVNSLPLRPMDISDDGVDVPRGAHSTRRTFLPYAEFVSLHLAGLPGRRRLLLETKNRIVSLKQSCFLQDRGPDIAFSTIRERILRSPGGAGIFEAMAKRESVALAAMTTRPWVTHALLGVMTIVFVNQLLFHITGSISLLAWGANLSTFLADGDVYRVVSAGFLHGHEIHFAVNGLALFSLGNVMERLLGWHRYAIVYVLSGLAAMAASGVAHEGVPIVGASGAILGVFGALAATNLRYRMRLPLGFRQPVRWWVFIIAINGALPLLFPFVDMVGHATGLGVGFLLTLVLLPAGTEPHPRALAGFGTRGIAWASLGVTLAGLVVAFTHASRFEADKQTAYRLATLAEPGALGPEVANHIAWLFAVDPDASSEQLRLGVRWVRGALDYEIPTRWWEGNTDALLPARLAFRDTLATLHYRLGEIDAAVRIERAVVESHAAMKDSILGWEEQHGVYVAQLGRFLAARREVREDINTSARIEVVRKDGTPPKLLLTLQSARMVPQSVDILAYTGKRYLGLLRVVVPVQATQGDYVPPTSLPLSEDLHLEIAWVGEATSHVDVDTMAWSWWTPHSEVLTYP